MESYGVTGSREAATEPGGSRPPEYSAMQRFFLLRLARLIEKSREIHAGPAKEWQRTLVKKAIFSTFNDCIALSLEAEALEVVRSGRAEP